MCIECQSHFQETGHQGNVERKTARLTAGERAALDLVLDEHLSQTSDGAEGRRPEPRRLAALLAKVWQS